MDGLTRENLHQHCRKCLERLVYSDRDGRCFYGINVQSNCTPVIDWIYKFTSINVQIDWHKHPKIICLQCYYIFKDLNSFQQLVWSTEKALGEIYGSCEEEKRESNVLNGKICKTPSPHRSRIINKNNSNRIIKVNQRQMNIRRLTRENLEQYFRTCLEKLAPNENGKCPQSYHVSQSEELADWIYNFAEINVRIDPVPYPKLVCSKCYDIFNDLKDFHQLVWETDRSLAVFLGNGHRKEDSIKYDTSSTVNLNKSSLQTEIFLSNTELTAKSNIDAGVIIKQEIDDDENSLNPEDPLLLKLDGPCLDNAELLLKFEIGESFPPENEVCINNNMEGTTDFSTNSNFELAQPNDDLMDIETEYTCEKCTIFFDNKYNCIAHKRRHDRCKTRGYKCNLCSEVSSNFNIFVDHMCNVHKVFLQPFRCQYTQCKFQFADWNTRIQHYHDYHLQKKAERYINSSDALIYEKDLFICVVCNKQHQSLDEIKSHTPTHGEDLKLLCGICGMQNSTQNKLNEHYDECHDGKNVKYFNRCKICKQHFQGSESIEKHILMTHKRIFSCCHCFKRFRTKDGLMAHLPVHKTSIPLTCLKCRRHYPTVGQYLNHMRHLHIIKVCQNSSS